MPVAAVVGVVAGVAGIASTIQGMSAQASNKKDIKVQNKAASKANEILSGVNEDLVGAISSGNKVLSRNVKTQNAVIDRTNKTLNKINDNTTGFISAANTAVSEGNASRIEQTKQLRAIEELDAGRSRRQSIREKIIVQGRLTNQAFNSGTEQGSGFAGGTSSLSSQLGENLGFQSRVTGINRNIFELSLNESISAATAQDNQNKAQLSQIQGVQAQRRAEGNLRVLQNNQNVAVTRAQNRVALLNNKADRIREEARLDPKKFLQDNRNAGDIAADKAEAAREKAKQQAKIDNSLNNDNVGGI